MFQDTYIKRRDVFVEGKKMPSGLTILKGALVVMDDRVPIRFVPHTPHEWDGWGEKFERNDENGTISFELHAGIDLDDCETHLMCTHLKYNGPGKNMDIKYARVREIVVYLPEWNQPTFPLAVKTSPIVKPT